MIAPSRLTPETVIERERALFAERAPRSAELARRAALHWLSGVPMHWMADWGTPFPLFVSKASGVTLIDADAGDYVDFCLGDTGAMYEHSPAPIADAIAAQAARGLTCMLPSEAVARVGELLADRFQLPFWQVTQTATDANRAALRWARAITGRSKVLVFQGCYHGTVDETMVRLRAGSTVPREGAIGPAFDSASAAVAVEFNDIEALERALQSGEIAAVIAEPVMTNIGMVLPQPGFLDALRARTRAHDVLLILARLTRSHPALADIRRVSAGRAIFGSVAKRSPVGYRPQFLASQPRSKRACAPCSRSATAVTPAWAPRSPPIRSSSRRSRQH